MLAFIRVGLFCLNTPQDCASALREQNLLRLANSLSPRHPRQKHLLTVKGLAAYKEIKG